MPLLTMTISTLSGIEVIANPTLKLLMIVVRVLASLVIFAVGLYMANRLAHLFTHTKISHRRLLSRTTYLFIIGLALVLAFQQLKIAGNLASSTPEPAVISQNHRKNVWTNVAVGGGGYVTGIFLHPLQKDLAYIRTDIGGFYRWNPAQENWIPITDHFPQEQHRYYGGEALAVDPNNPNIVYIAAGDNVWIEPGTIFKSTNQGATWTKLSLDLAMGSNDNKRWAGERLAVAPWNSNLILFGSRRDGLWKSSNAGTTWAKVTSFPGKLKENIGILGIVFDKNVSGLVYANAYGDGIYRSTDSGATWRKIEGSPTHVNRMAVASNGTLYVTSSKSPAVSKYANRVWKDITPPDNGDNAFNGLSVNPQSPNEVLISLGEKAYNKMYRSSNGGDTWTELKRSINSTVPWWKDILLKQPWTSAVEFDPFVKGRAWLTDWYGVWRTEDVNATPVVWTNHVQGHEQTALFTLLSPPRGALLLSGMADVDGFIHHNGLDAYPSQSFGGSGPAFQDTYSIAYCETDPLRMVRVAGNRWNNAYSGATSKDGGKTWQKFASFPDNTTPMRVAMSATNPNLFVVSVSDAQAIRTTDGGASWSKVSGLPNGPHGPWNLTQSLAADTVEGNTFYYYYNDTVYRSTDGGASFTAMSSLNGKNEWHILKTMPGVKGEVWAAFDKRGIYRSSDGGKTFSKLDGVERAYLFAFGKPQPRSSIPAVYVYGKITGMGDGIFRSLDRGKTWKNIGDPKKPIGKDPNSMEASKQEYGLVFVGTSGRGIYYYHGTQ